jgi:hypothetical protein
MRQLTRQNVYGATFYRYTVEAPLKTGGTKVFEGVFATTPHNAVKRILYPVDIHDYEDTVPEEIMGFRTTNKIPRYGFSTEWGLKHSKLDLLMPSPNSPWKITDVNGNEIVCRRRVRRPKGDWSESHDWLHREISAGYRYNARQERKSLVRGRWD